MAIQTNAPDKRNGLQDLVAAALRGEKVVIAVDCQPEAASESAEPKPDEEQQKPDGE